MNGPFLKDPGDRIDYIVDFDAIDVNSGRSFLNGDTISAVS